MGAIGNMIGLIAFFGIVVVPVLAIAALATARRAERENRDLREDLLDLRRQVLELQGGTTSETAPSEPPPRSPPALQAEAEAESELARPEVPSPKAAPHPSGAAWPERAAASTAPTERQPAGGMEAQFTSRWLVWLGGVALALGGIFLIKYSIDQNLLRPPLRVGLGLVLAAILVGAGEFLRRRPLSRAVAAIEPNYVPAALSAAGLITGFAAIYAGYALYSLYSPTAAFMGLAIVALAGIALALLEGPFVAALGLAGAYSVPILTSTGGGNALALFPYLLAVTLAGIGIIRYRAWGWLLWLTIAGSVGWVFLWFAAGWHAGDTLIVGLYLAALLGLFTFCHKANTDAPMDRLTWADYFSLPALPMPERAVLAAYWAIALAGFSLVRMDKYGMVSVILFGLLCALSIWIGRREQIFAGIARLMGLLTAGLVALWQVPRVIDWGPPDQLPWMQPVIPPELSDIIVVSIVWSAIFAIGGFLALRRSTHPGLWASLSAAVPISIFIVLHGRLNHFEININWSLVSLGLAGIFVAAATYLRRQNPGREMEGAIGAYAVGTVAGLTLAFSLVVKEAWLTVALALEVPGVIWVDRKLGIKTLRATAMVLVVAVIARLLLNPFVFGYHIGQGLPGINWLLYGYVLPALAFWCALRLLDRQRDPRLAMLMEAAFLAFLVAFISLEVRHLFAPNGRLDWDYRNFTEVSVLSLTWLAVAYALARWDTGGKGPVIPWAWKIVGGIAAFQIVLLQMVLLNPLWSHANVGTLPIFNAMLLAYGGPLLFALLFLRMDTVRNQQGLMKPIGIGALVLAFLWLTLEIRHLFTGPDMTIGAASDAEWYSYSVAWLLYGLALLGLGIWRDDPNLRRASLAVVMLTVAKVFLSDMSSLTGLYRVLSFLGLGVSLVGIGYLYQRFVTMRRPSS